MNKKKVVKRSNEAVRFYYSMIILKFDRAFYSYRVCALVAPHEKLSTDYDSFKSNEIATYQVPVCMYQVYP